MKMKNSVPKTVAIFLKTVIVTVIAFICLIFGTVGAFAGEPEVKQFTGVIDDLRVCLQLVIDDSGNISGAYYYEKTGGDLYISGWMDEGEIINLIEGVAASFTGKLRGRLFSLDNTAYIAGYWTDPDESRRLPFVLVESSEFDTKSVDDIIGTYTLEVGPHQADINITKNDDMSFNLSGLALYIGLVSVNTGDIEGTLKLEGNTAVYDDYYCELKLIFFHNSLVVHEVKGPCGGMNVSFSGLYLKNSTD